MTYHYLENQVEATGCMEQYFNVIEQLKDPTSRVLPRSLDIAACLSVAHLGDDYIIFGGYGVLSHMMASKGPYVATTWRGSNDIDMAGTEAVIQALKNNYNIISDRRSPNLEDKRTLILDGNEEGEIKIDFYTGPFQERFFPPEINTHFGVEFHVSNPFSLIKGKLLTPSTEIVHSIDIVRLLSVLEDRNYDSRLVSKYFTSGQKTQLDSRMKEGYDFIKSGCLEVDVIPSKKFIDELHKHLHKGRE